jgi:hypothetical protein
LLVFGGIIALVGIVAGLAIFAPDYTGENLNLPSTYPYGPPPFDLNKYNITKQNNTGKPVQNYTLPTGLIKRTNAGFIYNSLAAEEERPEPWALLTR